MAASLATRAPFMNGLGRFTIANDRGDDCLALLIAKEMIKKFQYCINLMGIEFYDSFDLSVSIEIIQDADLFLCHDALEH